MQGENFYATTHVLEASFSRLRELGIDTNADNIFKVVRSSPNSNMQSIFNSIVQVLSMAERLMAIIKILHNYSMQKMRIVGIFRDHE